MKSKTIKIGNQIIGDNYPVFIIAEAGVNHNGSLAIAKKLVDAAKVAGADAVKFQTFRTEDLVTHTAPKADYQKSKTTDRSQYQMLKKLELSAEDFKVISRHCKQRGILFLSTPFDPKSLAFLDQLGVPAFKISSGDLTNLPFLAEAARCGKPLILSTGMSDLAEVKEAVREIYSAGNKKLVLLHCTSRYPARYDEVNLNAITTIKHIFAVPVGYSDHTLGSEVAVGAVALGSCLIEKHFTLDKNMAGPDHAASLEPEEFGRMVRAIRHIEAAMGDGIKRPYRSEIAIQRVARKSIIAARNLKKGEVIKCEDLSVKRPGTGLPPKYLGRLIGRRIAADLKKDALIGLENIR